MPASARTEAVQTARRLIEQEPLFLDTETTGLERGSEILEIAIVDHAGQEIFQSLVRPTRRIPPDVIRIHHITDEMVQTAPTWLQIWPQIPALIEQKILAIYNAEFDIRLIQQTSAIYRISSPISAVNTACIMKLYAQFRGEWNPRYGNYRYFSLETAGQQCRIALPNSHRALDDALLAREVLHYIADA